MCVLAVIVLLEMTLNTYCAIRGVILRFVVCFSLLAKGNSPFIMPNINESNHLTSAIFRRKSELE